MGLAALEEGDNLAGGGGEDGPKDVVGPLGRVLDDAVARVAPNNDRGPGGARVSERLPEPLVGVSPVGLGESDEGVERGLRGGCDDARFGLDGETEAHAYGTVGDVSRKSASELARSRRYSPRRSP